MIWSFKAIRQPSAALQSYPGVGLVVRPLNEELSPAIHRIPHVQHLLGLHLIVQCVCEESRRVSKSERPLPPTRLKDPRSMTSLLLLRQPDAL